LIRAARPSLALLFALALGGCGDEEPDLARPARREQALAAYRSGQEIMRARDPSGAAQELRRAVALDPSLAEAWHLLGKILLHLSDVVFGTPTRDLSVLDESIAAFRRAAELEPANAEYATLTGFALSKRGERGMASDFLRRAIELDPEHGQAYRELGLLQAEAGEIALAKESLERATRLLPDDALAWFHYGQQLEAEEDFAGAKRAYERAIEVDWTLPGPYSRLAAVLRRLGDVAGAEEAARDYALWAEFGKEFRRVLLAAKAAPDDAALQLEVARIYLEAGRIENALIWVELALGADHDLAPAIELLRSIRADHPENERARSLLEGAADGGGR